MRLRYIDKWKSIDGTPVVDGEIHDFVVLSGPNGSGKSHLLEAIHHGAIAIDGVTAGQLGHPQPGIRLFSLGQFVTTAEGPQVAGDFGDRWIQLQQEVGRALAHPPAATMAPEDAERHVRASLVDSHQLTETALKRMLEDAGKPLIHFSQDDFQRHAPILVGVRDPFTLGVGELFLTYHKRRLKNEFCQFLVKEKGDTTVRALSDDEFEQRYGPPPWSLLDETLKLLGLEYHFVAPAAAEEDLPFEPQLVHEDTGTSVTLGELSAGEKTLMAVAMSLYAGSRLGEAVELPRLLLLDEADASLHRAMVASLLQVLGSVFVERSNVRVIMTTHSPSTVALAPAEALYTIHRTSKPRLRRTDRDEALKALTVGVPTLSVNTNNRRQVFVESEYDEACYRSLFTFLRQRIDTPLSLEFIAAGKGGGGGDTAVRHLVSSLRSAVVFWDYRW